MAKVRTATTYPKVSDVGRRHLGEMTSADFVSWLTDKSRGRYNWREDTPAQPVVSVDEVVRQLEQVCRQIRAEWDGDETDSTLWYMTFKYISDDPLYMKYRVRLVFVPDHWGFEVRVDLSSYNNYKNVWKPWVSFADYGCTRWEGLIK